MSIPHINIKNINILEYKQNFIVSKEDKLKYGEIYTPFSLIEQMFNLFDPNVFTQKDKKWLDPGAGTGYFSIYLFDKLNKGLISVIPNEEERKSHIIENMIYIIEIKESNIIILRDIFGEKANIFHSDFLSTIPLVVGKDTIPNLDMFDYIIGNPPYNSNGIKKVPTNTKKNKKHDDGKTIWISFIKKSISLLKENCQLCVIVPSIWLKPDKARTYHYLTSYKIEKIHCLSNTETNKIFKGEAQTPTCFFLLTKRETDNYINIFDNNQNKYINYYCKLEYPIPLFGQAIIQKLQPFVEKAGYLSAIKTNLPSINSLFSEHSSNTFPYPNIKTCILNGLQPELSINYSNIAQAYHGKKKLILAHKMYGFPYYDSEGIYGISNRDNYVIIRESEEELLKIKKFLSTNLVLYIYESTRYRMKYLEKYAFQFIPDITALPDFPEDINDESVSSYFGLDINDINHINSLHKKKYLSF
jgi:16S rRNA G966 N2-methylase RsmD